MNFNKHFELDGKHALLSPSKPYWLNYNRDQMIGYVLAQNAAARGTKLHDLAAKLIEEGLKLRGSTQTLTAYVNDAIGYGMTPGFGYGMTFAGFDGFNHGFTAHTAVPNSIRKIVPIPATASATNSSITYDDNGEIHVRPFDDEDLFVED